MSGLEVIGAIASIVSLIESASKVVDYVRSVKDAPKEAQEFTAHAETLRFVLNDVLDKARKISRERGQDEWAEELERLVPIFVSLSLAFQAFYEHVRGQLGWKDRLRWSHHKEKAKDVLIQINSLQTCLQTALTGNLLEFTSTISLALQQLDIQIKHLDFNIKHLKLTSEDIRVNTNAVRTWTMSEDQKNLIEELAPKSNGLWTKDGFKHGNWHDTSGRWLINSPEYQNWCSRKGAGLWCYGAAGAGKTVLAAIIIESLVTKNSQIPVLKIFFDRYNKSRPQTLETCMGSLWNEMASRRSFSQAEITNLENTHVKQRLPVSYDKWKSMLSQEIQLYPRVFIVIDALDEFDSSYQLQLIDNLTSLSHSINVLVTSRYPLDPQDEELFESLGTLPIEAHRIDLLNYVDKTIGEHRYKKLLRIKPDLRESISNRVAVISGRI